MVVSGSISGTSSATVGGGANLAILNILTAGTVGSLATPLTSLAVQSNGTLSGDGTVYGPIDASSGTGTVAPSAGNTAGLTIASGSLTLGANSTLQLSLANSNGANQPLAADYSKLTLGTGGHCQSRRRACHQQHLPD